jgi:2-methylcitrate dehydratase PrpD
LVPAAPNSWPPAWPAEVGIRVGEFLGRSHYRIFHTTATAGTLAAAAAVGRLLGLTPAQMQHAFGSAGTQSAGLWEFLRTGADSKQLHAAHAAAAGLMSAYLARDGFTGAQDIFTGPQGLAAGMSTDADPTRLTTAWAHAGPRPRPRSNGMPPAATPTQPPMRCCRSCRSTASTPADLAQVTCHVHQGAIDVLGPWSGRAPCTRASSPWARCWRWRRVTAMRG